MHRHNPQIALLRLKSLPWLAGIFVAGACAFVFISCSTITRTVVAPPEIPGATFVGNKVCFDCHTNISRAFTASPHARLHFEDAKLKGQTGCESCHGAASLHVQTGGGRGKFIFNPGKDASSCFQCHLQTHAEFNLPHHHPVIEGKMNCVQCHDPHGADIMKPAGGLAMSRLNESCAQCHREQSRLHVFDHPALREGCIVCHNPHGSINAKMLVERDANLCLKCHAQVPGTDADRGKIFIGLEDHSRYLRQGTCFSAGCHAAVHGSDVDHRLRY